MKIISGDETGLIKLVDVEENKVKSTFGEQAKDSLVQGILKLNDVIISHGFTKQKYFRTTLLEPIRTEL